jgi:hypothetical protein
MEKVNPKRMTCMATSYLRLMNRVIHISRPDSSGDLEAA